MCRHVQFIHRACSHAASGYFVHKVCNRQCCVINQRVQDARSRTTYSYSRRRDLDVDQILIDSQCRICCKRRGVVYNPDGLEHSLRFPEDEWALTEACWFVPQLAMLDPGFREVRWHINSGESSIEHANSNTDEAISPTTIPGEVIDTAEEHQNTASSILEQAVELEDNINNEETIASQGNSSSNIRTTESSSRSFVVTARHTIIPGFPPEDARSSHNASCAHSHHTASTNFQRRYSINRQTPSFFEQHSASTQQLELPAQSIPHTRQGRELPTQTGAGASTIPTSNPISHSYTTLFETPSLASNIVLLPQCIGGFNPIRARRSLVPAPLRLRTSRTANFNETPDSTNLPRLNQLSSIEPSSIEYTWRTDSLLSPEIQDLIIQLTQEDFNSNRGWKRSADAIMPADVVSPNKKPKLSIVPDEGQATRFQAPPSLRLNIRSPSTACTSTPTSPSSAITDLNPWCDILPEFDNFNLASPTAFEELSPLSDISMTALGVDPLFFRNLRRSVTEITYGQMTDSKSTQTDQDIPTISNKSSEVNDTPGAVYASTSKSKATQTDLDIQTGPDEPLNLNDIPNATNDPMTEVKATQTDQDIQTSPNEPPIEVKTSDALSVPTTESKATQTDPDIVQRARIRIHDLGSNLATHLAHCISCWILIFIVITYLLHIFYSRMNR